MDDVDTPTCDFCKTAITDRRLAVGTYLDAPAGEDHDEVYRLFCTWEHAQAWFRETDRGELERLMREKNPPYPKTLADHFVSAGCVTLLLLLVVLMGIGAVTVVGKIF